MNASLRQPDPSRPLVAILLAAGRSTRMRDDLVKVLHPVCDRPMLAWVIDACRTAGASPIHVIVGHQGDQVRAAFDGEDDLRFVTQEPQLGTGHAVMQARGHLIHFHGEVLVLAGDGPLIRGETLRRLVEHHRRTAAAATLATARLDDPGGYGRIVRDASGRFERIIEEKNASPAEKRINEVNPSYYCFRADPLFHSLDRLTRDSISGEYYLTDVCGLLRESRQTVEIFDQVPPGEVQSINTPEQLAEVSMILATRLAEGAVR